MRTHIFLALVGAFLITGCASKENAPVNTAEQQRHEELEHARLQTVDRFSR